MAALNIHWSFGFSKDMIGGVLNLTTSDRNALFFASSHSGVIYNFEHRTQIILQGHCNVISCCAVSHDKRWIVTSDTGEESLLVVWDSKTGAPVKTIFNPHPGGVISLSISSDCLYVVTLGGGFSDSKQDIALWAWTTDDETPIVRQDIEIHEKQHIVNFDPKNQTLLVTTGSSSVCFWSWDEMILEGYAAKVSKSEFGYFSGHFTTSVFLAGSGNAITGTSDGYIIFWESRSSSSNETRPRPLFFSFKSASIG